MKLSVSRKNIWENLPRPIRSQVGSLLKFIPPQYILGRNFRKNFHFVEEAQWWPVEKSHKYQLLQLKHICLLAYQKTLFYKRTFSDVGFHPDDLKAIDDMRYLPIINRNTIEENIKDMCTSSLNSFKIDYITTGGTSGRPIRFYIGADRSAIEYAYLISGWKRAGYKFGTPLAIIRGRVISENRDGFRQEYDPLLKHYYYSCFHMNDENMMCYINHIRELGPCYLHVYPSSVSVLARFIRRNSIKPPQNIKGIIAESENVYPEQRKMVEEVFECRYFSSYGHTEKLVAAAECEQSTNYHVWPTYGFFELLDEQNNPVKQKGQIGEIVGTGFINTVVPFIRYRTGDYAEYVGEYCDLCGREHTVISNIRGHNIQENLVALDGTLICWSAMNMHDDTFDNVVKFQFYQDTPGYAILKVLASENFNEMDEKLIQNNLGKKFDQRIKFKIEKVDSIPISNRGKAIFVDQHIPGANYIPEG